MSFKDLNIAIISTLYEEEQKQVYSYLVHNYFNRDTYTPDQEDASDKAALEEAILKLES